MEAAFLCRRYAGETFFCKARRVTFAMAERVRGSWAECIPILSKPSQVVSPGQPANQRPQVAGEHRFDIQPLTAADYRSRRLPIVVLIATQGDPRPTDSLSPLEQGQIQFYEGIRGSVLTFDTRLREMGNAPRAPSALPNRSRETQFSFPSATVSVGRRRCAVLGGTRPDRGRRGRTRTVRQAHPAESEEAQKCKK